MIYARRGRHEHTHLCPKADPLKKWQCCFAIAGIQDEPLGVHLTWFRHCASFNEHNSRHPG